MKLPVFSIIGLAGLYMLIFRNEEINTSLGVNVTGFKQTIAEDTLPKKPAYVDIYTGQPIQVWYDSEKHITLNQVTRNPVEFYINTSNWDTVYGRGQFVVNNLIIKDADGRYRLDESKVKMDGDELKIKDGNRKLKIDGEEFKLKDGDTKIKYDQEDGEGKVKQDSTKLKIDDGELKLKKGDDKMKADKEEMKIKKEGKKVKN